MMQYADDDMKKIKIFIKKAISCARNEQLMCYNRIKDGKGGIGYE